MSFGLVLFFVKARNACRLQCHVMPHVVRGMPLSGGILDLKYTTLVGSISTPQTAQPPPFFSTSASFLTSTSAQQRESPRHARAVVGGVVDARAVICESLCGSGDSLNSTSQKLRSQSRGWSSIAQQTAIAKHYIHYIFHTRFLILDSRRHCLVAINSTSQ